MIKDQLWRFKVERPRKETELPRSFKTDSVKLVALFDSHYPYHINIRPFLNFLRDYQPDVFVFGGDNWSLDCISHWNEREFRHIGMDNVLDAYRREREGFRKHVGEIVEACGEQCRFVYIIGNHEDWGNQFCQMFPQIEAFSIQEILRDFKDRFEFVQRGGMYRLGKLSFAHGDQFGSQNPAKQAVERCHASVVFGHHHSYKVWPAFSMVNDLEKYIGIQVPCFTGRSPKYGKGMPNAWQNGFFTATIKTSGNFSPHVWLVSPKGHFTDPYGREYE